MYVVLKKKAEVAVTWRITKEYVSKSVFSLERAHHEIHVFEEKFSVQKQCRKYYNT